MLIVLNQDEYDDNKVNILEKTNNNVINDGFFYRITYNDYFCSLSGIFLFFTLHS